jgi:hypothetical protein
MPPPNNKVVPCLVHILYEPILFTEQHNAPQEEGRRRKAQNYWSA